MKKRPLSTVWIQAPPRLSDLDLLVLLRRASPVLLVLGAWMACHPFAGITHDSRIYVAQAFLALYPDVFGQDLFFQYGSQDDFTFFSRLFAPLVAHLGPTGAAMAVVAIGHAIWLSGAAALARRLAPDGASAIAGLVLLAVIPGNYGGWSVFTFGEGFATPRILAEGIGMWALWALTERRLVPAAVLVVLGGLLHPLVTVTVIGVGFLVLVFRDWRWILPGLAGAAAIALLAYLGIPPFDRLVGTMDAEWLSIVQARNTYLFPALWTAKNWAWLVATAIAALASAAVLQGWRRHLLLAATLAGLGGLLATHIGADRLHNLFLIQVQLFRALWLLHVFALLGTGVLLTRLWRLEPDGHALIALAVMSLLTTLLLLHGLGAALATFTFGFAALRLRGLVRPLPNIVQAAGIMFAGFALGLFVVVRIFSTMKLLDGMPAEERYWDATTSTMVIEAALVAILSICLWRVAPRAARTILPAAALGVVVLAAANWDRRSGWEQVITSVDSADSVEAMDLLIARDAQVYWENDVRGSWLLLRRPAYVSKVQGAGIAFERRTAMTYRDRTQVVQPLTNQEMLEVFRTRGMIRPPQPALTRSILADTCRKDRVLDAMVLSRAVPGAYAAEWALPAPINDRPILRKGVVRPPIQRLYLYRCVDLR